MTRRRTRWRSRCRRRCRSRPITASTTSLAVTPACQFAVDPHQHVLHLLLDQALGGQYMLHLGGPDAVGQAPVRRGSRCGNRRRPRSCPAGCAPCSGPTTWTMPWRISLISNLDDIEIPAVIIQGLHLQPGYRVADASPHRRLRSSGSVGTLWSGHREVGIPPPGLPPGQAQALQRPGARSPRASGDGRCRSAQVPSSRSSPGGSATACRTGFCPAIGRLLRCYWLDFRRGKV